MNSKNSTNKIHLNSYNILLSSFLLLLAIIFSTASYKRNLSWHDDFSLLTDAYEKSPRNARTLMALGGTYYHDKNMYEESVRLIKMAIDVSPDFSDAHYGLGLVYFKRAMSKEAYFGKETLLDAAIAEYAEALKTRPGHKKALPALANAYAAKGDMHRAIDLYEKIRTQAPNLSIVRYNLGIAYRTVGRHDEAINEFKAVSLLEPDKADPLVNIGASYAETGRNTEAIEAFKNALKIVPGNPDVLYNMGITYERMGLAGDAENAYRAALTSNPDFPEARAALNELQANTNKKATR